MIIINTYIAVCSVYERTYVKTNACDFFLMFLADMKHSAGNKSNVYNQCFAVGMVFFNGAVNTDLVVVFHPFV